MLGNDAQDVLLILVGLAAYLFLMYRLVQAALFTEGSGALLAGGAAWALAILMMVVFTLSDETASSSRWVGAGLRSSTVALPEQLARRGQAGGRSGNHPRRASAEVQGIAQVTG